MVKVHFVRCGQFVHVLDRPQAQARGECFADRTERFLWCALNGCPVDGCHIVGVVDGVCFHAACKFTQFVDLAVLVLDGVDQTHAAPERFQLIRRFPEIHHDGNEHILCSARPEIFLFALSGRILHKEVSNVQHILFLRHVGERVVRIGEININEIQDTHLVAVFRQDFRHIPIKFAFRIGHNIAAEHLHNIRLDLAE